LKHNFFKQSKWITKKQTQLLWCLSVYSILVDQEKDVLEELWGEINKMMLNESEEDEDEKEDSSGGTPISV